MSDDDYDDARARALQIIEVASAVRRIPLPPIGCGKYHAVFNVLSKAAREIEGIAEQLLREELT